jgi:hypothetical protein
VTDLDQLIGQAQALAGFPRCRRGEHLWTMTGGRRCPRVPEAADINCSQVVYECAACGEVDYGYRGGPAHRDCFIHCPNETQLHELTLEAQAPRRPATSQGSTMNKLLNTAPATIDDIERLTKVFAGARAELADRVDGLRVEQEAAKRRRLQGIKNSIERAVAARAELHDAIAGNPGLFEKPKTRVLHNIRVGFYKQPGKLEIADDEACVAALRKLYGGEADAYIKTTEKPIHAALKNLPAKDLAKLGIGLGDDVDAVMIKPADDAVDKLVDALTGDIELEAEAERA